MEKEKIIDLLYEELECKHGISKQFVSTLLEAIKRFDKKQDIFTTENIADTGEIGLHTRISDRIAEIKRYLSVSEDKREELMLTEEKITKDFLDIGIYGFIGYIYRKGNWK